MNNFLSRHQLFTEKIEKIKNWEEKQNGKKKKLITKMNKKKKKEEEKVKKQNKATKSIKTESQLIPPKKDKSAPNNEENEEKAETTNYSITGTPYSPQCKQQNIKEKTKTQTNLQKLNEINQLQKNIIDLNKYKATTEKMIEEMRNTISKLETQNKTQTTRIKNLQAKNKDIQKDLMMTKKNKNETKECKQCYNKQQQINMIQSKLIMTNKTCKKTCEENNHLSQMIEQYDKLKDQHEAIINKLETKIQAITNTKIQLQTKEKKLHQIIYDLKNQIEEVQQKNKHIKNTDIYENKKEK